MKPTLSLPGPRPPRPPTARLQFIFTPRASPSSGRSTVRACSLMS